MPEPRLCSACSAWPCRPDDAWCGYCGALCAQLKLQVSPDVLQVRNMAPNLTFKLSNSSCASMEISDVDLPDWLTLPSALPPTLPALSALNFSGKARTLDLKEPSAEDIVLTTSLGRARTTVMVIEESPQLQSQPGELELWGASDDESRQLDFDLFPSAGSLRIRSVEQGPSGGLRIANSIPDGSPISAHQALPVSVTAQVGRFRNTRSASLWVGYDGPHGPARVEVPLRIALKKQPQIRWAGEHQAPPVLFQTSGQRLSFELINQSQDGREGGSENATLHIQSASLTLPSELQRASVQPLTDLPISLPGGKGAQIVFGLNFEDIGTQQDTTQYATLTVQTNGPALRIRVPFFVRPLPEFDGVLAIDFGSSNTCCAVVETGREYERLTLDKTDVISPTVIRYLDLSGAVPVTETGQEVKERAAVSEAAAAGTIGNLKQRLGDRMQDIPLRPTEDAEWTTRKASDAAADYLHQVRRVAETVKGSVFRQFILTHPAVCSLRQYRNLYGALTQAFGHDAERVRFLQEPIAALVPLFAEKARTLQRESYTVASFDLGGGTTDIALVRVDHVVQTSGRLDIRPNILYCRGVRFGGEDLTEFLVKEIEENCNRLIASHNPGWCLVARNLPGASMVDVLRNRYALRNVAESFKASLSDERRPVDSRTLSLQRQPVAGGAARLFACQFQEIQAAAPRDLKASFLNFAASEVRSLAQLLHQAVQQHGTVDFIQLSGKTSFLPVVGAVLRELFPDAIVERAPDPKECVVTGACLSHSMSRGMQRRLVLPGGTQRTTSSIGIYDPDAAVFTSIAPVDTEIPAEGLVRNLPGAWFGSERIALWENLGVDDTELRSAGGSKLLTKLGTWEPQRKEPAAQDSGWDLHIKLQGFQVHLSALGPDGQSVSFRQLPDSGGQ